jgi:hypothetical protein
MSSVKSEDVYILIFYELLQFWYLQQCEQLIFVEWMNEWMTEYKVESAI